MKQQNKRHKFPLPIRIILGLMTVILVLAAVVFGFFGYLTLVEYNPDAVEEVAVEGSADDTLKVGDTLDLLTWNIGYAGLDASEDFFLDGGKHSLPKDRETVEANMAAITDYLVREAPDVIFLQEVDRDSRRTYHIDEVAQITGAIKDVDYSYGLNYKVAFIPYPIPPLGSMDAGIVTVSDYAVESVSRYQLPCPFSWPVRLGNLKRCLLVSRVPIEDSDRELVLINLHLEAYDDGEGKLRQTQMLAQLMAEEYAKGNYVIAGGDFNQSFSNIDTSMYPVLSEDYWAAAQLDASAFGDHWQLVQDTTHPSCRSLDRPYDSSDGEFQFYMIDGFIVSDNLTIESLEIVDLDFANSDHNPVKISVTLQ